MKTTYTLISVCFVSLFLSGCALFRSKPIIPIVAPPASPVVAASADLSQKEAQIKASVAANVETARKTNAKQVVGPLTDTVESELALASKRLDTTPDPAELLFGEQRARAIAEGRTDEARKMYADATQHATEEAKARAKAESDLGTALTNAQIASAQYQKSLDALNAQHKAEIDKANSKTMHDQVVWFNCAGGVLALIFGLSVGFGGIAGLRVGWVFGLLALLAFGLAQIVAQSWFVWAVGGVLGLALVGAGVWIWQNWKHGTLATAAKVQSEKLLAVTKSVIPVLDQAYDEADTATKELLDKAIFSKLSAKMDTQDKNTVLEIKKVT